MNSVLPAGIVQVRSACPRTPPSIGVVVNVPARNHTEPDWPTEQSTSPSFKSGFFVLGIEKAHCHHSAAHSPYVIP